jgi:hypothetical protein
VSPGKVFLLSFLFLFVFSVFNYHLLNSNLNSILFTNIFTYFNYNLTTMTISWFCCAEQIFNISNFVETFIKHDFMHSFYFPFFLWNQICFNY